MAHSVGLVANKPTVVRAYLDINTTGSRTVTGDLLIWRPLPAPGTQSIVTATGNATVDPTRNGQIRAKREDLTASLNFVLPPQVLASGPVVFRLVNVRDAAGGATVGCVNCAVSARAVSLQDAPPLRVRLLGLSYPFGNPPSTQAPRTLDFDLIASWLRRAYPTPQVQMAQLTIPATSTWPFTCTQANAQVAAVRNVDVNNGADARTHYYGLVSDGGGFMRGCSAIPAKADPSAVGSGPTGCCDFGWDTDGSYGDWYTGHELGHTFGRIHIGSGCGDVPSDPFYPFPAGQLSGADEAFVGFDVGDSSAGRPIAALPGTGWHDEMSYCDYQWISSYTYRRIWARLAAEDLLPSSVAASGVAAPQMLSDGASTSSDAASQVSERIPEPMSGSGGPRPLRKRDPAAATQVAGDAANTPGDGVNSAMRAALERQQRVESAQTTQTDLRESLGVELREGGFVNVVAMVNATATTGSISYVNRVSRALVPSGSTNAAAPMEAEVRAVDANGRVLFSQPAQIRFDSDKEPSEDKTGIIDIAVPVPAGVTAVEVLLSGRVVDHREVGGSLPAPVGGARALEISSTSEAGGRELVLDWGAAARTASASVTYIVLASTNNGVSWQTIAVGLREPKLRIDANQFGVGRLTVRVIATNGLQNVELASQVVDSRSP
jgi:hypothetical protein